MSQFHEPVLLNEVLKYLDIQPDAWYVDCNLGGGGHANAILEAGGKVLGIDLDPEAIKEVANQHGLSVQQNGGLEVVSEGLILCQGNFIQIQEIVKEFKLTDIKGILFDLGVSTHQLETPKRGFSFNVDAPLDMRMDPVQSVTAADLINGLHEKELVDLFEKYGEERYAKRIARKIIQQRQETRISTTKELALIVANVYPKKKSERIHPATRIFQALRIAVNDELNSLKQALPQVFQVLSPTGRIVAISFHSLEDRIVKNYFKQLEEKHQAKILTPKPVTPTEQEIQANPRSRSGKLRAIKKIIVG
jgi:16S rRNA (cytosine1402-N4)-methyltransferase